MIFITILIFNFLKIFLSNDISKFLKKIRQKLPPDRHIAVYVLKLSISTLCYAANLGDLALVSLALLMVLQCTCKTTVDISLIGFTSNNLLLL